jgi:PKD repeat protein
MKFKIYLFFILFLAAQRLLADGCNTSPFNVTPNCDPNSNPLEVCFDPGVTSDQPSDTDYTWDFGDGSTTTYHGSTNTICHTYAAAGTYTVTLTLVVDMFFSTKTCVSTVPITVYSNVFTYSVSQSFDCNTNTGSLNLSYPPSADVKWDWDPDTLNTNVYPNWPWYKDIGTPDGNISLATSGGELHSILIQRGGCFYTEYFTVANFNLSTDSTNISCYNANNGTAEATVSGGTGPYTYTWSNGTVQTTGGTSTISNLAGGSYTVQVTDASGCLATHTLTITNPPEVVSDAGPDIMLCTATTGNLGAASTSGYTYSWAPATGLNDATVSNPTITLTNTASTPVTTTYIVTTSDGTCTTTDTVGVTVNPLPTVNSGLDGTVCSGSDFTLAGNIGGAASSGTWSGGAGTYTPNNTSLTVSYSPSASEITAGIATLILTTDDPPGPCPSVNDTLVITINPSPLVNAGPPQTICIGGSAVLAAIISGSATSGTWSGGAGTYTPDNTTANAVYTPSAAEATAGTVMLTYTSDDPAGPCPAASDQMQITINQLPTANAGSPQYVCEGNSISLDGSVGGTATSGTWSGGTGTFAPDNTTLNAIYTPSAAEYVADSVTLTLTTDDPPGPCSPSSSTVVFHFYNTPVVNFTVDDPDGCPIHCVNLTDMTTVGGGANIVSWNWSFSDGTMDNSENPFHCFSQTGFYDVTLTATSNHNCSATLSIPQMIQVFAIPVAEFNPSPNPATVIEPSITMYNLSSSDVTSWNWNFGDSSQVSTTSQPTHLFPNQVSGSYVVTLIVQNVNGCADTISHTVFIGPEFTFFIPNSFSPNGDGVNDYFFGKGIGIIDYNFWIFDRWGNLIFNCKTADLPQSQPCQWSGVVQAGGADLNTGSGVFSLQDVYVWKVELMDVFEKKHNYIGTVTIVR